MTDSSPDSGTAATPTSRSRYVPSHDGGTLHVRDWGPLDAPAVIALHGTPSSSFAVPGGWNAPHDNDIRVITFDRPGYGESSSAPQMRVADAARWCAAVADDLGIAEFAVIGTSGGGPFAAGAAALLADRVTRLCIDVGLGPVPSAGFDVTDGMLEVTRDEIEAARSGRATLESFAREIVSSTAGFDAWWSLLPPADTEVLGRADVRAEEAADEAHWQRHGHDGWIADDLAFFHHPWGFDLADVVAPTRLLYGGADVLVPASHGAAYREAIPHAELIVVPDGGHWLRDAEPAQLRWLVGRDDEA